MRFPYYWAIAPDYDLTFSPRLLTRQGVLMRGEFRQRLINGAYSIRLSGIYQLDPEAYIRDGGISTPGNRNFRGSVETTGNFALSDKWTWGWDGILPTDPTFFQNYGLKTYQRGTNILVNGLTEGVSQPISPAAATAATSTCVRSITTAFPNSTRSSKFPSSIPWSITPMFSASRCSEANSAIKPT